jgi:hypothetical protein
MEHSWLVHSLLLVHKLLVGRKKQKENMILGKMTFSRLLTKKDLKNRN